MRNYFIGGNWKMNMTVDDTAKLIKALNEKLGEVTCEVCVFPPAVCIPKAVESKSEKLKVGGQTSHELANGAYTGDITAEMLKSAGATHVLVGHSERRQYHGETDVQVNAKVQRALTHKLIPVICVGEDLSHRDNQTYVEFIKLQLNTAFAGLTKEMASKCIVAYEPVWAIGTGRTASASQAEEVCLEIRKRIARLYDGKTADSIRIIYGGSMNSENAASLMSQTNIDGGLIGGASLKADDFTKICKAATEAKEQFDSKTKKK